MFEIGNGKQYICDAPKNELNQYTVEQEKKGNYRSESVFSRKIKAGKRRTYFFDVKATKSNDYFLTITESKKRQDDSYERYKIFLYKEDFNKFIETLSETIDHIKKELMPQFDFDAFNKRQDGYEPYHQDTGHSENESVATAPEAGDPETPYEKPSRPETSTGNPGLSNPGDPPPVVNEEDLKW